jgi:hypothetical protein
MDRRSKHTPPGLSPREQAVWWGKLGGAPRALSPLNESKAARLFASGHSKKGNSAAIWR